MLWASVRGSRGHLPKVGFPCLGSETAPHDTLATTPLGLGDKGRYLTALTFGNVHGVYKPGNVKLRPEILKQLLGDGEVLVRRYGGPVPHVRPEKWVLPVLHALDGDVEQRRTKPSSLSLGQWSVCRPRSASGTSSR
jgi:hypothetical protein